MKNLDFNTTDRILLDVLEGALVLKEPHRTNRIKEILSGTHERGYAECQEDLRTVLGVLHPVQGW